MRPGDGEAVVERRLRAGHARAAPSSAWSGSRSAAACAHRASTARCRSRCRRRRPAVARTPGMWACAAATAVSGRSGATPGAASSPPVCGPAPARTAAITPARAVGQRPQPIGDERAPGREHRHAGRARPRPAAAGVRRAAAADAVGGGRPRGRTAVVAKDGSLPPRTIAAMAANPLRQLPSVDALLGRGCGRSHRPARPSRRPSRRSGPRWPRPAPPASRGRPSSCWHAPPSCSDRPPSLRPVLNATGVIVHTNLGRAPLAAQRSSACARSASGYSNLEYDLAAGARGSRHTHLGGCWPS